jgi:hypothetical protein
MSGPRGMMNFPLLPEIAAIARSEMLGEGVPAAAQPAAGSAASLGAPPLAARAAGSAPGPPADPAEHPDRVAPQLAESALRRGRANFPLMDEVEAMAPPPLPPRAHRRGAAGSGNRHAGRTGPTRGDQQERPQKAQTVGYGQETVAGILSQILLCGGATRRSPLRIMIPTCAP